MLQFYNTLSRTNTEFKPIDPTQVRMYVCGPTVYDYAHIGNARPVVVFDLLFRLLRQFYGESAVVYVRNITDIDDKIIQRHLDSGESIDSMTHRLADAYVNDMQALNNLDPSYQPRATQHIDSMISIINLLLDRGHAYQAQGHVLFHVPSNPHYGKLSRRDQQEQIAGMRVEVAAYKRDPADFVLWKPSAPDMPGWNSPWGRGRPGWHIECSAMSAQFLGPHFDIHGGGHDLIFPHHENEIAQSECAHGGLMAHTWMHNGFLLVNGQKMSKSNGNFFTVRDLLFKWPGEAIRLLLLKTHYRSPLDFTEQGLQQALDTISRWQRAIQQAAPVVSQGHLSNELLSALADDLNTPAVIAGLDALATKIFSDLASGRRVQAQASAADLLISGRFIGLLMITPEAWFSSLVSNGIAASTISEQIALRQQARTAGDFKTADQIRNYLRSNGVILEDHAGITTWRRTV